MTEFTVRTTIKVANYRELHRVATVFAEIAVGGRVEQKFDPDTGDGVFCFDIRAGDKAAAIAQAEAILTE